MHNTSEIATRSNDLDAVRYMQDAMRRAHSGRWPLLRMYSARRSGTEIREVARWLRGSGAAPFAVVTWSVAECRMSWRSFRTLAEARKHARTL